MLHSTSSKFVTILLCVCNSIFRKTINIRVHNIYLLNYNKLSILNYREAERTTPLENPQNENEQDPAKYVLYHHMHYFILLAQT